MKGILDQDLLPDDDARFNPLVPWIILGVHIVVAGIAIYLVSSDSSTLLLPAYLFLGLLPVIPSYIIGAAFVFVLRLLNGDNYSFSSERFKFYQAIASSVVLAIVLVGWFLSSKGII